MRTRKTARTKTASDLGQYLTCELTCCFYEDLTTGEFKGTWDASEFFELFRDLYALILAYRDNPLRVIEKLDERLEPYQEEARIYMFHALERKLDHDFNHLFLQSEERIKICHNLIAKEIDARWPSDDDLTPDHQFNWKDIACQLETIQEPESKIAYLINISAEHKQFCLDYGPSSVDIAAKCEIEIDRIKRQMELDTIRAPYKGNIFLSGNKGNKINLIRIVNAMYELRFFHDGNGQIPTKENVMTTLGKALGVDLSKYDADLSQALNTCNIENNVAIFQQMSDLTKDLVIARCKVAS